MRKDYNWIFYNEELMVRKFSAVLLIVAMVLVIGCVAHRVEHGPAFNRTILEGQWYLLYGLVPLNDVDTQTMADGRRNYEITTQVTLVDFIYRTPFYPATITCRTVTVTR